MRHGLPKLRVLPPPAPIVAETPPDPFAVLVARFPVVIQEAAVEVLGPVLAERDQRIADLEERVRLERINADKAERLHAQVDRAQERRIAELGQENDAKERHIAYLRSELASRNDVERLAKAIVGAKREPVERPQVVPESARMEAMPPMPAALTLDVGGLAREIVEAQRPMFEALRPEPSGEVEIVRDERGNVSGARRKKPRHMEEGQQLPLPE